MATRKSGIKQVMTKPGPSGHKAVGVTPPFIGNKKPAPAAPVQSAPMKIKSNKGGGMC